MHVEKKNITTAAVLLVCPCRCFVAYVNLKPNTCSKTDDASFACAVNECVTKSRTFESQESTWQEQWQKSQNRMKCLYVLVLVRNSTLQIAIERTCLFLLLQDNRIFILAFEHGSFQAGEPAELGTSNITNIIQHNQRRTTEFDIALDSETRSERASKFANLVSRYTQGS